MNEHLEGPHGSGGEADQNQEQAGDPSQEQPRTRGELRRARTEALKHAAGLKDRALEEAAGPGAGSRGAILLRSAEAMTVFPGLKTNDNGRFAELSRTAFLKEIARLDGSGEAVSTGGDDGNGDGHESPQADDTEQ